MATEKINGFCYVGWCGNKQEEWGHTYTLDNVECVGVTPAKVAVPVLAVHLSFTDDRQRELKLLLAAGLLGFLYDTTLVNAAVFSPLQHLVPRPFSPPWMVCIWMNFAATLNVSMVWLRGRYLLAAVFGAIGSPMAYYSGAKLGATQALISLNGMLVLAVGWGVMTPLLVWLARVCAFRAHMSQDVS